MAAVKETKFGTEVATDNGAQTSITRIAQRKQVIPHSTTKINGNIIECGRHIPDDN